MKFSSFVFLYVSVYSIFHRNNSYNSSLRLLLVLCTLPPSIYLLPPPHRPPLPPPLLPNLSGLLLTRRRLPSAALLILTFQRMRNIAMISLAETPSGMKHIQGQHGQDNHDAFEHNKVALILNQFPFPALRKLDDTVDAADEDTDCGEGEGDEEAFEFRRGAERCVAGFADVCGWVVGAAAAGIAFGADGEVDADEDEDGEGEDLE